MLQLRFLASAFAILVAASTFIRAEDAPAEDKEPICRLTIGEIFTEHVKKEDRERFLARFDLDAKTVSTVLAEATVSFVDPKAEPREKRTRLEGNRKWVVKDRAGKDVTIKLVRAGVLGLGTDLSEKPTRYSFRVFVSVEVDGEFKLGGVVPATYGSNAGFLSKKLGYDATGKAFDPEAARKK